MSERTTPWDADDAMDPTAVAEALVNDPQAIAETLEEPVERARELAEKLGLSPRAVKYWLVSYEEMRALIARQGFQDRYPHWRWGMLYEQQQRQEQFLGGKAFEIVNNDDPSHAFLQSSNSLSDQKAVITHVEAHSDFFANNQWFRMFDDAPDAARMLARHAETIEGYMQDPDIGRDTVEEWIDHVLTLELQIDQWSAFEPIHDRSERAYSGDEDVGPSREDRVRELSFTDEIESQVFGEWLDEEEESVEETLSEPEYDLLGLLYAFGQQYDEDSEQAIEMDEWQRDVLAMLREEAYYFAAQRMTKVMNEGWAAYWESKMMADELFATDDEFVSYADQQSKVLGSGGLNPYALGNSLWRYVENRANRTEVVKRLLQVEDVTWHNFHDRVDFEAVLDALEPPAVIANVDAASLDEVAALDDRYVDREALDRARAGEIDVDRYPWMVLTYDALVERHYSLVQPANRGFLAAVPPARVEELSRYILEPDRYASVEQALADVEKDAGWERMREVRESKNDLTFVDEYLTQEFVDHHGLFAYEYSQLSRDFRVTSTDVADVRKKLLLEFTNFGKPRVGARDVNFRNQGELLLAHEYNGVRLDLDQAEDVLERLFELWGRPVNLETVEKRYEDVDDADRRRGTEPSVEEVGVRIRYDGERHERTELDDDELEAILADEVDYDTTPDAWPTG